MSVSAAMASPPAARTAAERLARIIESDRRLERLARAYTLAGVPIPAAVSGFAGAAFAAGVMRAELALEGYREPARTEALLMMGQAQQRAHGLLPRERAAFPQLLAWLSL